MTDEMPTETILVVDDDEVLRNRLEKSFIRRGWTVFTAEGFEQAIQHAKNHQPDRAGFGSQNAWAIGA